MSHAWHARVITETSHPDIHSGAGSIGGSIVCKEDLELVAHNKAFI
jgi:hypothetical protein